ncbi:MAG TPA: ComEC/Rec2 family competence protein [Kiritimatiellia bacterium]|nr:ComEC/Rec2 family competence protein [Kiritimatiellia bacterium]
MEEPEASRERRVVRRPLLGLAVAMILGCALGGAYPIHPLWPLGVSVAFLVPALVWPGWAARGSFLLIAVLCAGMGWSAMHSRPVSPAWVGAILQRDSERVDVEGWIRSDPIRQSGDRGGILYRFDLGLTSINREGHWVTAQGRIDVMVYGGLDVMPRYGDRLRLSGILQARDRGRLSHLHPHRMRVQADEVMVIGQTAGHPWVRWSLMARGWSKQRLERGIVGGDDAVSLTQALLLGVREGIPARTREAFARTGSLHILAISGLHVGILSGLLVGVFRSMGVPRHRWVWAMIPALAVYSMATGGSVSAVRASVMICCYWLGPALSRRPDSLSAMGLAALILLTVHPHDVFNPGFHLSFAVVLGLLIMTPRILGVLDRALAPDPWAQMDESSWLSNVRSVKASVVSLAAVAVAAWLASFPLIALSFNVVSPIALPANLVIVPLAFLILLSACLSLTLGSLIPGGSVILNHAHLACSGLMLDVVDLLETVGGGHWFIPSPSLLWVLAWFGGLGLLFLSRKKMSRGVGIGLLVVCGVMIGSPDQWSSRPSIASANFSGFPVYLVKSGKDRVVIEPGPHFQTDAVVRWLRQQGVNRLRAVVLTRPLARPAQGVGDLIQRIPVEEVWAAPPTVRGRGYEELLESMKVPVRVLHAGDRGSLAGRLEWEVLHPAREDRYDSSRDAALVIRFARDAVSWGVYGSTDPRLLEGVLRQPRAPAVDTVLAIQLEDPEGWPDEWFDRVRPSRLVFHPGQVVQAHRNPWRFRDALEQRGVKTVSVEREGVVLPGSRMGW